MFKGTWAGLVLPTDGGSPVQAATPRAASSVEFLLRRSPVRSSGSRANRSGGANRPTSLVVVSSSLGRGDQQAFGLLLLSAVLVLLAGAAIVGRIRLLRCRRRVEDALRVSEERVRLATLAVGAAMYDWDLAADCLWWSQRYLDLFAPPASGFREWWSNSLHAEDRTRVAGELERLLAGPGDTWSSEYSIRRPDGEYVHVMDRAFIVRDDTGQPTHLIGAVREISDRRQSPDNLEDWSKCFQAAMEATGHLYYEWDPRTKNVVWTGAGRSVLGSTPAELGGAEYWFDQIVHPDDRDEVRRQAERCFRGGDAFHARYRARRKDGKHCVVEDVGRFFRDQASCLSRMVGCVTDITRRWEAERELRKFKSISDQASYGAAISELERQDCLRKRCLRPHARI